MKKIVVLLAFSLAGCATAPPVKPVTRPQTAVVPPPVVTVVPAAPVPPGTFKMRWNDFKTKHKKVFRQEPK